MEDESNPLPENTLNLGNEKKFHRMEPDLGHGYDLAKKPSEAS